MLRDRLGVSERWACRVVGQHRSTQRRARSGREVEREVGFRFLHSEFDGSKLVLCER